MRLPDGSTLASALERSWELREAAVFGAHARQRARHGRKAAAAERAWSAAPPSTSAPHDSGVDDDLSAASHLSRRRRRRFLNDCLLRELAGPLLASDIAALYAPVPFGVARATVLAQLASKRDLADAFLELRVDAGAPETTYAREEPVAAAWARVGRRGRAELRRGVASSLYTVQALEAALRDFLASDEELRRLSGDGYARLLTHALCAWSGAVACSSATDPETGARCSLLRRRRGTACAALPACSDFLLKTSGN